jgi:hypothetical protein
LVAKAVTGLKIGYINWVFIVAISFLLFLVVSYIFLYQLACY